jgi:hypothetical protein
MTGAEIKFATNPTINGESPQHRQYAINYFIIDNKVHSYLDGICPLLMIPLQLRSRETLRTPEVFLQCTCR